MNLCNPTKVIESSLWTYIQHYKEHCKSKQINLWRIRQHNQLEQKTKEATFLLHLRIIWWNNNVERERERKTERELSTESIKQVSSTPHLYPSKLVQCTHQTYKAPSSSSTFQFKMSALIPSCHIELCIKVCTQWKGDVEQNLVYASFFDSTLISTQNICIGFREKELLRHSCLSVQNSGQMGPLLQLAS